MEDVREGAAPPIQAADEPCWPASSVSLREFVAGVTLPLALAELGLIDEYEFVAHSGLPGHGAALFAGLPKHIDLKLVSRLEFSSGAVAMRHETRPSPLAISASVTDGHKPKLTHYPLLVALQPRPPKSGSNE